ncbi:acid protease [Jackrogersella minutella]|nr:acid protease [Jackrogersella minutella]
MLGLNLFCFLWLTALSLATPAPPHLHTLPDDDVPHSEDIIHSLSIPGFQFRRVKPLTSIPIEKKVRNYADLRQLPRDGVRKPRRSAAALFGQVKRESGGDGYENVTSVNLYATEYAVTAVFDGTAVDVVVDSSSADTWVRGSDFRCRDGINKTVSTETCGLGPSFAGNFSGGILYNQHISVKYADGENVQGRLGYMDVEFAGVTVHNQEMAIASQGTWIGNNVTSGILGLAYPSLTSAYRGNNLDDDSQPVPYPPLFTSMVANGLVSPYWGIAISRNSSLGSISIGGMPPVDVSESNYDLTPILIVDIIHKSITASQPSFYTIVPKGFQYGHVTTSAEYPFIIDTATSIIYLPPDLADAVNAQFDPPATYVWYYDSYFTSCNATPPHFGVRIGKTTFWVNPQDLLNSEEKDPLTGLCQTGIGNGGTGPYILGAAFLTNVVVLMNIGSGQVEFWSHEFY